VYNDSTHRGARFTRLGQHEQRAAGPTQVVQRVLTHGSYTEKHDSRRDADRVGGVPTGRGEHFERAENQSAMI